MKLQAILNDLDIDTILVDNSGKQWSPDNINASSDSREYCIDGEAVWQLGRGGFRTSKPVFKLIEATNNS